MAYPDKYTRQFDYQSYQNSNPTRPLPGDKVNADLNVLSRFSGEVVDALQKITRDDGALANGSVSLDQLTADLQKYISGRTNSNGAGNVIGPSEAVGDNIVVFDGDLGTFIKDSGKSIPAGAVVGTTDAQILTGKTISGDNNTLEVRESDLNLTDNTVGNVSTARHGFVPKLPNNNAVFLNGAGEFTVPPDSGGGATLPFVTVNSNADLQALSTDLAAVVYRLGFATQGDSPALIFLKSDDPCDLNDGLGDGASQVPSSDGKSWRGQFNAGADIRQFGALDNTGTDDVSPQVQAAIDAMTLIGAGIFAPIGKWLINTPLNLSNRNNLYVKGVNSQFQSFGLLLTLPATGTVFVGNTNGKEIFSCLGSNNLFFENFTTGSLGAAQPSKVGFLFGVSAEAHAGQPGGANYNMRNVAIQMAVTIDSIPIYYNNGSGLCTWDNVSVSGDYGFVITSHNDLSITPTYGTYYGTLIGTGAVCMFGCTALGSGTRPIMKLRDVYSFVADNFYSVLPGNYGGGPSYTGQQYPILIQDSHHIKIFVENDYWPALFVTMGTCDAIEIKGLTFPNTTALGANTPLVGAFLGTTVTNSKFDVQVTGAAPSGTRFWYVSSGANPATLTSFYNNDFSYNTTISVNVLFLNVTSTAFNIRLHGNVPTAPSNSLQLNAAVLPASAYRIFINGVQSGAL